MPIEEMADRGDDVLRFGPLRPVGLRDPRTGKTPYAVVQLRKENREGSAYNIVGFQTRMTWPAQREAFGRLPGLARAEWLRLGVMHRNTFIDSPRLLDAHLKLCGSDAVYFAGQITGAEGYVEAAACGAMTGIHAARAIRGLAPIDFPRKAPSVPLSRICRIAKHRIFSLRTLPGRRFRRWTALPVSAKGGVSWRSARSRRSNRWRLKPFARR